MVKYRKIVSLLLSLGICIGMVPTTFAADLLNNNVNYTNATDVVQLVNDDGSITEVPILTDDEAIELLKEQVEPEEYKTENRETSYQSYWNSVPIYWDSNDDGKDESCFFITIEGKDKYGNEKKYPLYTSLFNKKTGVMNDLYLYGIYEFRELENKDSPTSDEITYSTTSQLFYTTLPYKTYDGGIGKVVGFTSSGKSIPNTVFDPRMMRNYDMGQCRYGGSAASGTAAVVTDVNGNTRTIDFDGMGDAWFEKVAGVSYEKNWPSYSYPLKDGTYATWNLKNGMQTTTWGIWKQTEWWDPSAMVETYTGDGTLLMIPRRVYSAESANLDYPVLAAVGPATWQNDSGPAGVGMAKKQGLYSAGNMQINPWRDGAMSKYVEFSGSVNQKWMNEDGSYKAGEIKKLKTVKFTPEEVTAILSVVLDEQNTDWTVYENLGFSKEKYEGYLTNTSFAYMEHDSAGLDEYGIIKNFEFEYGTHVPGESGDQAYYLTTSGDDYSVSNYVERMSGAGEYTYNDFGWYELMLTKNDSLKDLSSGKNFSGNNITNFQVGGMSFFVGPMQKNIYGKLRDAGLSPEKAKAYIDCVYTGKFLYMLQFICVNGQTVDPAIKKEDRSVISSSPVLSWHSLGKDPFESLANSYGVHYNDSTLSRSYQPIVEPDPVPTLTKDLVVSSEVISDGLIDDDYLKTNLYKVNPNIPDAEFESIVGMSKDAFNLLGSSNVEDGNVKSATLPGNIKSMDREKFLKCFVKVDGKEEKLDYDTTYILQSGVYGTASLNGEWNESIPESDIYASTFNDDIYVGWKKVDVTGKPTGIQKVDDYKMNDTSNNGWHSMLPAAINDVDTAAHDKFGDALISSAPSSVSGKASAIAGSGNRLSILGFTRNADISTGSNTFEKYNSSNVNYTTDKKEKNFNIYRGLIHVPTENETPAGIDQISFDVFLYNPNCEDRKAINNVYSDYEDGTYYSDLLEVLYESYKMAAQNISGIEPEKKQQIDAAIKPYLTMSGTTQEEKNSFMKNAINKFVSLCGQENIYKAMNNKALYLAANKNDNVNPETDICRLVFNLQAPPTPKQTNLRVKYVTIYGRPKGTTEEWTETFRTVDLESFKQADGKYVIDLPKLGNEFNINYDYVVCFGQQFDSLMSPEAFNELSAGDKETVSKSSVGNLYMYGYIQGIGGRDNPECKTTLDYTHGGGTINDPWVDSKVDIHLDAEGTWRTCTKPSDSVVNGYMSAPTAENANRVFSGDYYAQELGKNGSGVKHKADGTTYIDGTYILGVDPIWSQYGEEEDENNDNTTKPLPCDDANPKTHCPDPETVYINFRFTNGKDFDNKITEIYLIDKEGDRINTTEDCFAPGKITDIDINSSNPYYSEIENLADHSYSLVVKVERNVTGKEHKDIGSQCQLTFVGNMFGREYTETEPLVLSLANSSGNIQNDKHHISNPVYNNGNSLAKNGDYITYYVNGLLPIQDTEICGTFIFKHREEDGTLSTNDMNMLNNYKKGAVNWGPLDYIVSNLVIWPNSLYADEDEVWLPTGGSEDLVSFTCNIEAQYTGPNGERPIINNEKLWTNFTIYRESRPKNSGTDYIQRECVYRIDLMKLTINGGTVTVTGKFRNGRAYTNTDSNLRSEGYPLRYNKDTDYRFVARINGGNGISETSSQHEHPYDQKVKLETVRTNNKDYAELPVIAAPPDDEPLCPSPHTRNDWTITFHWTECPTPHYYTCCSGDPSHCSTCCTGTGCHSWTGDKNYWETYKMSGYVRSTANGWTWEPLGTNIELRAGQKFQISIHSDYNNNRAELPPPEPYGGCTWRSRSPGHNYTSAYRYIRVMIKNTANSQYWKRTSNIAGWHQELESPEYTVPEDTKNLTITVKAETAPFYGVREKGNQQLCTNYSSSVRINSPLPIASGSTQIY